MKIINRTPHPVSLCDADGNILRVIESDGQPIRLAAKTVPAGDWGGVPLSRTEFGEPVGMPEPEEGTLYIVSQLVKSAFPGRKDLMVPAEVVRDAEGKILGCQSLGL